MRKDLNKCTRTEKGSVMERETEKDYKEADRGKGGGGGDGSRF